MKNSVKFILSVILVSLVIALVWNIFAFYQFGAVSALFWHGTLGIILVALIPLHVSLHFKKFKKLAYEFYGAITGKKSTADSKKQIMKHLGVMKLEDFALWHGLSYEALENLAQQEYHITIHQEETLDELSQRANEEVFALYLKTVEYKLNKHTS